MQNFDLSAKPNKESSDAELQMSVSSVCEKDNKQIAYVTFSDSERKAEGVIPECRIVDNSGFSDTEVVQLEDYMRANLTKLKKMAAKINVLDAFMGKIK